MSRSHISMRKIREILRLRFSCKRSQEIIAKSIGIGRTTVQECLDRAKKASIGWPLPEDITDEQLEITLYTPHHSLTTEEVGNAKDPCGPVDWAYIHKELKRKSVTRIILWEEYKLQHPQGELLHSGPLSASLLG